MEKITPSSGPAAGETEWIELNGGGPESNGNPYPIIGWMSNDKTMYDYYSGKYHKYYSDPPMAPQHYYGPNGSPDYYGSDPDGPEGWTVDSVSWGDSSVQDANDWPQFTTYMTFDGQKRHWWMSDDNFPNAYRKGLNLVYERPNWTWEQDYSATVSLPDIATKWDVYITYTGQAQSGKSTITLNANPTNMVSGQTTTLTYTVQNFQSGDYVDIEYNGNGKDMWENAWNLTKSTESYQETEYPAAGNTITVNYTATLYNSSGQEVDSDSVSVTWSGNQTPTISLSANPHSTISGNPIALSYTVHNMGTGDYVVVSGYGGQDMWGESYDTSATDSYTEVEYPQNGNSMSVTYTAVVYGPTGQALSLDSISVSWTSQAPSISISAYPSTTSAGYPATISYYVNNMNPGDYVTITGTGGQDMWSESDDTNYADSYVETENPSNGSSTTVYYTATLYDASGQVVSRSTTTVTWTSNVPQIKLSAAPSTASSGNPISLSYYVTNMGAGDYVKVQGSGGQDMWSENDDMNYMDSYSEVENPENGASTTVTYTATVYSPTGQALAQSSITVKWTSAVPTITMSANPTSMLPGQPSTISYSVQNFQSGDYVDVMPSGSGSNMWSASNQTQAVETYQEEETPAAGQTVTVNYTATVYNQYGQALSTAKTSVKWTNAWTGSINLTANPQYLPTGQPTTLKVTTTQSLPSGYNLFIEDTTTNQVVAETGATPYSTQYTSYNAETDDFVAYVNDGYENVGPNSNTVSVTWSDLSLSADPPQLPVNQTSTLTVKGMNVPAGDYLIVENETTGQIVGVSQSTPYSVQQTQSTAQSDTYIAYISSSPTPTDASITSNPVTVDWYGLILVADKTRLPVNNTSTLTATAQNLPDGYIIDIVDQTTGQVIASGQPGQTQVQALQTKSQAETDSYIAQAVEPGNPQIPGLSVPQSQTQSAYDSQVVATVPGVDTPTYVAYGDGYVYASSENSSSVAVIDASTNQVVTKIDIQKQGLGSYLGGIAYGNGYVYVASTNFSSVAVIDPSTYQVVAMVPVRNGAYDVAYANGYVYVTSNAYASSLSVINASTNQVVATVGFPTGSYPDGVAYYNGYVYVGLKAGGTDIIDPNTNQIVGTLPNLSFGPEGVAFVNGYAYMPTNYQYVQVIDLSTDQVVAKIRVGTYPRCVAYANGYIYVSDDAASGTVSVIDPSTNQVVATVPLGIGSYGVAFGNGYAYVANMDSNTVSVLGGGSDSQTSVSYFPFWTFQSLPSYVPVSLFTQQAVAGSYSGSIWMGANENGNFPNGTGFFEGTFNLPKTENVTFQIQSSQVGDYEQVYVDGNPILEAARNNEGSLVGSGVPNSTQTTITLPAGEHQVIIEGMSDNGFSSPNSNPAGVNLEVIANGSDLLDTGNPSKWMTTGYITQLPPGWFSGAVGSWNWTEYVLQEDSNQPIYQQQDYSLTNTAQDVAMQSNVVSVTWYNPIVPPDNFGLTALPSNVTAPAQTQFKVSFDQTDSDFVNQNLGGSATVEIRCVQTWQKVASATWTPNSDGLSIAIPYSPVPGSSLQYIALLVDKNDVTLADSNQVTVTDTGLGQTGSSSSSTSCSGQGDGTEVFDTYKDGKLVNEKVVPLTITDLEVDGIFNPTAQLKQEYPGNTVHLPVTNAMLGYAPIPLRVQAPFGFAVKFPDAQPTKVEAVFSVNGGASVGTVDEQGDTSWTVEMHPSSNLPQFWQGETIMPKLPDGAHISVTIKAYDDCGENDLTNQDFLVTAGRPQWYFAQPSKAS
ncbi:hypothetical protein [Alicyclobacillus kakegawensis]|uniref:hypothetical protein n=1 Tax=Alicyclobacillus kakegawensis TaxID=392012 RepID=UPI0014702701|nr:hypothetical protein [Alicyclobacillus kakegawensis]